MGAGEEMLAAFIASSIALGIEIQSTNADFNEATGMMGKYDAQMLSVMRSQQDAGVSYAESAEAFQSLIVNMTQFTAMTESQQTALANTAAVLNELGVATETTTQNLQIMR